MLGRYPRRQSGLPFRVNHAISLVAPRVMVMVIVRIRVRIQVMVMVRVRVGPGPPGLERGAPATIWR